MDTGRSLRRIPLLALTLSLCAGAALAEPCILAYPLGQVTFRYNTTRYEVKGPGDPLFDPLYAIGGLMLWDRARARIAFEVYQAPGLDAFVPSLSGRSEFLFLGAEISLVIDGFAEQPRQLSDVLVQFTPRPLGTRASILVNNLPVVDLRYPVPRMVVSTPTPNGYFSDTTTIAIGCAENGCDDILRLEIIVYQDRNGNRVYDGDPCIVVIMENFTVPVEESTWGAIKAMYGSD